MASRRGTQEIKVTRSVKRTSVCSHRPNDYERAVGVLFREFVEASTNVDTSECIAPAIF